MKSDFKQNGINRNRIFCKEKWNVLKIFYLFHFVNNYLHVYETRAHTHIYIYIYIYIYI